MCRLDAFVQLEVHPWYGRHFKSLSDKAFKVAVDFMEETALLTHDEFVPAVNRMFLDKPEKPKGWELITELLTVASRNCEESEKKPKQRRI